MYHKFHNVRLKSNPIFDLQDLSRRYALASARSAAKNCMCCGFGEVHLKANGARSAELFVLAGLPQDIIDAALPMQFERFRRFPSVRAAGGGIGSGRVGKLSFA